MEAPIRASIISWILRNICDAAVLLKYIFEILDKYLLYLKNILLSISIKPYVHLLDLTGSLKVKCCHKIGFMFTQIAETIF